MAVENTDETVEVEETQTEAEKALENDSSGWGDDEDQADESTETEEVTEEAEAEDDEEDEDSTDDEPEESDDKEEAKVEPEPETKEKPSDEEQRKAHNREMAQKRLKEKQERQKATQESHSDYLSKADPNDARDLEIRQLQVNEYNNRVEINQNKVELGYERALRDFPVLNDSTPEIKEEVTAALEEFNNLYVTKDKLGNPTEVRADMYQFLQAKADSIQRLTSLGEKKQSTNKARQRSKTTTLPSRAPKENKDAMEDGFDEEANRY